MFNFNKQCLEEDSASSTYGKKSKRSKSFDYVYNIYNYNDQNHIHHDLLKFILLKFTRP